MATRSWLPRFVKTNGIRMVTYEAGSGPTVVLLHGFPELAYSWRYQLGPLSKSGWRAIAPDLRGYGGTGPCGDIESYSMQNLSCDILGMLDALEIERTVLVGHDFGGMLAWSLARDHPNRVMGVVSLNTPYTRRGTQDLVRTMLRRRGETNYMVMFQRPGLGEALLERDIAATFRGLMCRPALKIDQFQAAEARLRALPMTLFVGEPAVSGEPIMSNEDLEKYIEAFRRTGFTGALNWYRNLEKNWKDTENSADSVNVPALMIVASDDFFLPPQTTRGMEQHIPDLERKTIENCGHWTQQESPGVVNATILDWLERRMRPLYGT